MADQNIFKQPSILGILSILDDSVAHNSRPMPTLSAKVGGSVYCVCSEVDGLVQWQVMDKNGTRQRG